jgi:addiction module RelE/StbE family toxin
MNELTAFHFGEGREVRTLERNGEPWFVAKDVCDILDIQNRHDALAKQLDDDEKGVEKIYSLGGKQDTNIINESGLYNLIFRSNKPEAKAFRKWVTSEVLPSIRKTGRYALEGHPALTMPMSYGVYSELVRRVNSWERSQSRESKREIRAFFDEMIDFTCEEDDFITTKELYEACKAETDTPLIRLFKRDRRLMERRNKDIKKLKKLMALIIAEAPLPRSCREHPLHGAYEGCTECHVESDWLLVYRFEDEAVHFARTGSHSDIF